MDSRGEHELCHRFESTRPSSGDGFNPFNFYWPAPNYLTPGLHTFCSSSGWDLKKFTGSNVQKTHHCPQTVHRCSSSFQPLSQTLDFSSCPFKARLLIQPSLLWLASRYTLLWLVVMGRVRPAQDVELKRVYWAVFVYHSEVTDGFHLSLIT